MNEKCKGVSEANRGNGGNGMNKITGWSGPSEVVRGTNKGMAPTETNNGAVLIVTSSKSRNAADGRLCCWKQGG